MSEDVSATVRLGITICLLAALMGTVLSLFITGDGVIRGFAGEMTAMSIQSEMSAIKSMHGQKNISGAMLYRFFENKNSSVTDFTVTNVDGTVVTDTKKLLRMGHRKYNVTVVYVDGKGYNVTAVEVPR